MEIKEIPKFPKVYYTLDLRGTLLERYNVEKYLIY